MWNWHWTARMGVGKHHIEAYSFYSNQRFGAWWLWDDPQEKSQNLQDHQNPGLDTKSKPGKSTDSRWKEGADMCWSDWSLWSLLSEAFKDHGVRFFLMCTWCSFDFSFRAGSWTKWGSLHNETSCNWLFFLWSILIAVQYALQDMMTYAVYICTWHVCACHEPPGSFGWQLPTLGSWDEFVSLYRW